MSTIRSRDRSLPILKIRQLGPLHRTQGDDEIFWHTDNGMEMLVIKTTDVLHLLICLYLSTISTQCMFMSLVVATKNSNKYLTLGTVEMDMEDVLSSLSSGNASE
jgi:hypothetical protein